MTNLLNLGKKIVAIGKNYQAHAIEMGAKAAPKEPVVFLKPTTSYVENGQTVLLPKEIGEVHHEVELGVVVGETAKNVKQEDWEQYVAGYALVIDMTARSLQEKAKAKGLPWTQAKSYDTFTPVSEFIPVEKVPKWDDLNLWLKVDGELKQSCKTGDMVHSVPFLVSYLSKLMTLEKGDLIITGTPSGVGPVFPSQTMTAGIEGLTQVSYPIKQRSY